MNEVLSLCPLYKQEDWDTVELSRLSYRQTLNLPVQILIPGPHAGPLTWINLRKCLRHGDYPHSAFSSVQFSRSVVSSSMRPHESQHTRPPCPSPTPRVHWNSCPSSRWCHLAISSSVIPFSSCPRFFPALGSFPMSQLFTWGGQSNGVSALASFLPKNTQGWSPLELSK